MSAAPDWIEIADVLSWHEQVIAVFGGSDGMRDAALLESALARPRHMAACGTVDLCELAGAYAHGLAKNHPFVDGNKRIAFVVCRMFLGLNEVTWNPPEAEAVVMVEGVASGDVTQDEFVAWIRRHAK